MAVVSAAGFGGLAPAPAWGLPSLYRAELWQLGVLCRAPAAWPAGASRPAAGEDLLHELSSPGAASFTEMSCALNGDAQTAASTTPSSFNNCTQANGPLEIRSGLSSITSSIP